MRIQERYRPRHAGHPPLADHEARILAHANRVAEELRHSCRREPRTLRLPIVNRRFKLRKRRTIHLRVIQPRHPRRPSLRLTLRRDGRWCKKLNGKTCYLGMVGTSEADARAKLVAILNRPEEQMSLFKHQEER